MPLYAILKQKCKHKLQGKLLEHGDFAGSVGKAKIFGRSMDMETGDILEQGRMELSGPAKVLGVSRIIELFCRNWEIGLTGGGVVQMETVYVFLKHSASRYTRGKHFDSRY